MPASVARSEDTLRPDPTQPRKCFSEKELCLFGRCLATSTRRPPRQGQLPLLPTDEASLNCLLGRLHPIHDILLRRRFSDAAAARAVDEVLRVGRNALDSGKAARMSAERRAGWLWRVAFTAARRVAAKERIFVRLKHEPEDTYRPCPEDDGVWEALRNALDRLPTHQKHAVELCGLQGLSLREAARQLGVVPGTVGFRFRAGVNRLACALNAVVDLGARAS